MFIDTHCHLEDENFSADRTEVLARAKIAGVERIINFGSTFQSSIAVTELAKNFPQLYAGVGIHPEEQRDVASNFHDKFFDVNDHFPRSNVTKNFPKLYAGVGIHPEEIDDFDDKTCARLAELAAAEKVVAIGEIGLDYHWEKDSQRRLIQQKIFIAQLDLARQLNLPVCVHDRDAHADTLKILQTEARDLRGVLHCYSGSVETAREVFKLGWFIGVDGPLTFKNSAKLPEVVKSAPRDKLLIETDAPYLAPTPHRGKRNEPAYVVEVAKKLAELRGETLEEVAEYTAANAKELYKIF